MTTRAAAVDGGTITAALTEYGIELSDSEIGPNGHITVTNNGTMAHDLGVRDTDLMTASIAPGASATLDLAGLDPGTYELYCDVAGHADSGMTAHLVIDESITAGGADGDAAAMGMTPAEHAAMTASEGSHMDQAMTESILAFPAETAGEGNQPLSPTILPDGTKRFELTASVIDWEVTPGTTVQAWAYNGMVPGPRIDLEVGDRVEVQVTNELPVGTDIHWHGIDVPSSQDGVAPLTQDLITTGQTYTYRFTATEAAIGMYHAHAHAEQGVPNGLFGTLYVGHLPLPAGQTISGLPIPSDLVIAEDIPMVLNDAGAIGLSLNGKGFPATAPLRARPGRLGPRHVLQRGSAGAPDAPPRLRADRHRQGRRAAGPPVCRGHHPRGSWRALHGALQRHGRRDVGVALPHPQPRRVRGRHVRDGDRRRRRVIGALDHGGAPA